MPADPVKAASVQRWLSIAAAEIAHRPCSARLVEERATVLIKDKQGLHIGGQYWDAII